MSRFSKAAVLFAIAAASVPLFLLGRARGSDHADTPEIARMPGADLTDVFIFPSPTNPNNVVLAMCVNPLIPSGQGPATTFDPNVLYQFKIDNAGNGDIAERLVIQAKFSGTGPNQTVSISGPIKPDRVGVVTTQMPPDPITGTINQTFTTSNGLKVFAGAREDPFFFDLDQFFKILPDRATPLTGVVDPTPNKPKANSWRPPGQAKDALKGFNVMAIVVELPKTMLTTGGDGKIRVWCTTSI